MWGQNHIFKDKSWCWNVNASPHSVVVCSIVCNWEPQMNRLPVRGRVAAASSRVISCHKLTHHLQSTLDSQHNWSCCDNHYLNGHFHSKPGHWLVSLLALVRLFVTDYQQSFHWLITFKRAAAGRMNETLWVIRSRFSKPDQCECFCVVLTTVENESVPRPCTSGLTVLRATLRIFPRLAIWRFKQTSQQCVMLLWYIPKTYW